MRANVAKAFVLVAFFSAVPPVFADAPIFPKMMVYDFIGPAGTAGSHQSYWRASSGYLAPRPAFPAGHLGHRVRHVLITGYHPRAGFEAETAREAAASH